MEDLWILCWSPLLGWMPSSKAPSYHFLVYLISVKKPLNVNTKVSIFCHLMFSLLHTYQKFWIKTIILFRCKQNQFAKTINWLLHFQWSFQGKRWVGVGGNFQIRRHRQRRRPRIHSGHIAGEKFDQNISSPDKYYHLSQYLQASQITKTPMNTFDAGLQVALQIMFAVLKKVFISIIQSWRYSRIYFWCPSGPS